ncbi:phage N-6-adenine-methyltransferase [Cronobacter dublinensis]
MHALNAYNQALAALRSKPVHELKEVGDQWRTPDNIFWGINAMFGPLVLDLFSDGENAKCEAYYTAEDNALTQDWSARLAELNGAAFGNPPYSRASRHDGQYITGMRYIMQHASAMREKGGRYVFLIKAATGATGQEVSEPAPTVTAGTSARPGGNGHALGLVEAMLTPFMAGNGGSEYQAKPRSLEKPAHTILKESRACVVAPVIARQFGNSIGHRADEPSATITAGGGGKSQLVTSTLIQMGYGEREGQAPRILQLEKPLGTVTAGGNKFGLVAANLVKHFGGNYTGPGAAMDAPAHTVTTTDHHGLVTSHLVMLRGTCRDGRVVDAPAPGLTAGGLHVGEVETQLAVDHYDEERAQQALEFLRQYCGENCDGLVTVGGVVYRIVDIGMRMLQPHELYRAQGFPEWYIIDRDYSGKKYAKDKQVARCGNAVPPPFAEALVRANLPDMCEAKQEVVA